MRSPEKRTVKYKKGLWSPDEDHKLTYYVMNHGHDCWSSVATKAGLHRNGKSCRLRWINYLRPGLKRGQFSSQEEDTILTLHGLLGNKWSQISQHLPGRTDNEIKNYWHCHLKKKVDKSHAQVHRKLDNYTHSNNMASKEPSLCSLTTSNIANGSCDRMVQSVPRVSHVSNLPKLLFAEWISIDEFQQDIGLSSDESLSHGSNYQLTTSFEHERQYNKGSTEGADMGSNENMLHSQMTIDQCFEFNVGDLDIDNLLYM